MHIIQPNDPPEGSREDSEDFKIHGQWINNMLHSEGNALGI